MKTEARIYQLEEMGWYVELAGQVSGPLDSAHDAHEYLQLIEKTQAARTEVVCLDNECF